MLFIPSRPSIKLLYSQRASTRSNPLSQGGQSAKFHLIPPSYQIDQNYVFDASPVTILRYGVGGEIMSKLQRKVALVTGASKGIGAGIANALASAGAAVVVNYASDRAGADGVVNAITKAKGRAVAAQADVSKPADVARMFAEAERAFGTLDILVNNAGVYATMPLEAMTEEEFHREFNTNVLGPILVIRESLKHFGPDGGSIINIGSAASRLHPPRYSVFTPRTAGLRSLPG